MSEKSNYEKFAAINVGEHIEKKANLSYLSWAWAVDQLLRVDPKATWEYKEPVRWGETVMVFCTVTAFDKPMTAQLPVMDHRNKAIANPDAFQVNTAMQRCLAKAIALHGLGLYIYAGEDLPLEEAEAIQEEKQKKTRLPTLTDEEAEKAYNEWMDEKGSLVYEDGVENEEAIKAAWFKKESNVRAAITRYGKSIQTQLDKEAQNHLNSI